MPKLVGGRYEILRKIAEGGMGAVYEARHHMTQKVVALKILFPHIGKNESSRQRFLREVSAPAQIGHDGIVDVLDSGFDPEDGSLFVAMELLKGETLREWLQRGGRSRDEILDLFERLLDPLAAAHANGIVHRDLKPENVFLHRRKDGSTVLKILDFGIARDLDTSQDNVTHTGVAMGTPHYMAPEQAMSAKGVQATADVWAVGAMLYEALTGRPPFEGETASAIVVHTCTQPHPPIRSVVADLDPAIAALVDRCLDKTPQNRPRDAAELGRLLREARRDRVGPAMSTGPLLSTPLNDPSMVRPPLPSSAPERPTAQFGAGPQTAVETMSPAPEAVGQMPPQTTGPFGAGRQAAPFSAGTQTPPPQQTPQFGTGPQTAPQHMPQFGAGTQTAPQHMPQFGAGTQTAPQHTPQFGTGPQTAPQHTPQFGTGPQTAPQHTPQFGAGPRTPSPAPVGSGTKRILIAGAAVGLLLAAGGVVAAIVSSDDDAPEVMEAMAQAAPAVASILTPDGGGELLVDGTSRGPIAAGGQVQLSGGPHTLELRVGGQHYASQQVVAAGAPLTVNLAARTAPPGGTLHEGTLGPGDQTLNSGEYADHHSFQWTAGQRVRVDLHSDDFDTYLIVKAPSGSQQDNDDAVSGNTDAGLEVAVNETGQWTVIATSYRQGETGAYQLTTAPR